MSPVRGLTVNPNNLAAHRHFASGSHGVLEGWGFSHAVTTWTFLSPEGAFYPSPGLKAWVRKPTGWRDGSPERACQTKVSGSICFPTPEDEDRDVQTWMHV
jgi:hypothetical protein